MGDDDSEELRWLPTEDEEADPDYALFHVLHQGALPRAIYLTDSRSEQLNQVAWLAERGRWLEGMLLHEFYIGPIQPSELVNRADRLRRARLRDELGGTQAIERFWDA